MATCGIPRIDNLLLDDEPPAPLATGDADRDAVGVVQDLLIAHAYAGLPGPLGAQRGSFGPRTTECVKDFQQRCGLQGSGRVDRVTLGALLDRPAAAPVVSAGYVSLVLDVRYEGMTRLMGLTSQFEGAGRFAAINLNTDKAGLSFGLIQWAQKPLRLAELLRAFEASAPEEFVRIFGGGDAALAQRLISHTSRVRGGTDTSGRTVDPQFDVLAEPWLGHFREAALSRVLQRVQVQAATAAFDASRAQLRRYAPELVSERQLAFMLDLANQHGDAGARGIHGAVGGRLEAMADESVRRVAQQFGAGSAEARSTRSRRDAFRTSPLLSDQPVRH